MSELERRTKNAMVNCPDQIYDDVARYVRVEIEAAILDEREACAAIAADCAGDNCPSPDAWGAAQEIARKIRARPKP